MKENIKALVKEIVPIIVGVLIALYINNWNEDKKDKAYIDRIFSSINKELTETNQDILNKLSIQKSFIDTLDLYIEDTKISLFDLTIKAGGISIPSIKMNAWTAISNSKIELMDYDKISTLANIEEQKEILKMKTEKLGDFLYSNTEETGRDKKEIMKILMLDIISTEIPLQKYIEKIIND